MLMIQNQDLSSPSRLPLSAAVDLQDRLLTASNDLERLQALLVDASDALMREFFGASRQIHAFADQPRPCEFRCGPQQHDGAIDEVIDGLMQHLGSAVIALQFQDMASQLIAHTHQQLRHCADRIAGAAMTDDEDGTPLTQGSLRRPNPITQNQMSAGSVDLF